MKPEDPSPLRATMRRGFRALLLLPLGFFKLSVSPVVSFSGCHAFRLDRSACRPLSFLARNPGIRSSPGSVPSALPTIRLSRATRRRHTAGLMQGSASTTDFGPTVEFDFPRALDRIQNSLGDYLLVPVTGATLSAPRQATAPADLLIQLSRLTRRQRLTLRDEELSKAIDLARRLWDVLDARVQTADHLASWGVQRWSGCVQAVVLLQVGVGWSHSPHPSCQATHQLLDWLCDRLIQGDALSRMTVADLAHSLDCVSTWPVGAARSSSAPSSAMSVLTAPPILPEPLLRLASSLARRLRKQSVRSRSSPREFVVALRACRRLLDPKNAGALVLEACHCIDKNTGSWTNNRPRSVARTSAVVRDIKRLAYTLSKEILIVRSASALVERKTQPLSTLFRLALLLELDSNDPVVEALLRQWGSSNSLSRISADAAAADLAWISSGLIEYWDKESDDLGPLVQALGDRLLHLAKGTMPGDTLAASPASSAVRPSQLNHMLRLVGLRRELSSNKTILAPYLAACQALFRNEDFLTQCSYVELSNFSWFLYRAYRPDEGMVAALARRILAKTDHDDDCPPNIASRILSTFTSLYRLMAASPLGVSSDVTSTIDSSGHSLLSLLYDRLGAVLLLSSHTLSPQDLTSAVIAYGRSAYVGDMGIFDHLVQCVADRLEELDVRSMAQCLWACGRMIGWETATEWRTDGSDSATASSVAGTPVYLPNAISFVEHLERHSQQLSAADVTQTLWALANLLPVCPPQSRQRCWSAATILSQRAKTLTLELRNADVVIILWAMGRLSCKEYDVVYILSRRFADDAMRDFNARKTDPFATKPASSRGPHLTPQECSMVLQAMGQLDVYDVAVFRHLTHRILEHIDDVSAQSVAVALWAHRAVHQAPPQALMDQWARHKLGIVAIELPSGLGPPKSYRTHWQN